MKQRLTAGIALGVVSLCLVFIFTHTEIFQSLELKFLDYRFRWRPQHKVNPDIVIVAIDDSSIAAIGRWPWPRKIHAELLRKFSDYPPKVIGFDVLFTEKEPGEGDAALGYYSNLLGNVLYAGYLSDTGKKIVSPIIESPTALINAPPDKDGIIRKIPLVFKHNGNILPSFTLQALCTYLNVTFTPLHPESPSPQTGAERQIEDSSLEKPRPSRRGVTGFSYTGGYISIPGFGDIPIDTEGNMWINYVGDQHVFEEIAFHQAINWERIGEFGNKLLLIGITATGIGDQGHIPIATNVPLITVHANALNTILNRDFLIKMPNRVNLIIIAICVFVGAIVNLFFRSIRSVLLSLFLIILYISVNLWLFQRNISADLLGPSLGFIVPFLLITVYRYGWEERQARWIKKAFAHYLSKDVIDTILLDPKKLQLGGELKTATVLYLDLRNFSGYCEGKPPSEIVGFLNQSFDWMTEIILRHGGMLDKYIGDAIMAIFGAPLELPPAKQAYDAVLTSVEIAERWYKDTKASLDIGIGINTGPMLIGNMGSRYIFNYTAIGDEVNIAARLQELCSEYNVNVMITDSVYNLVRNRFKIGSLGKAAVKGRRESVAIYKVLV